MLAQYNSPSDIKHGHYRDVLRSGLTVYLVLSLGLILKHVFFLNRSMLMVVSFCPSCSKLCSQFHMLKRSSCCRSSSSCTISNINTFELQIRTWQIMMVPSDLDERCSIAFCGIQTSRFQRDRAQPMCLRSADLTLLLRFRGLSGASERIEPFPLPVLLWEMLGKQSIVKTVKSSACISNLFGYKR